MFGGERLNYFSDGSFIKVHVKQGTLKTKSGTRVIAVNEDFLKGFVAAVEYEAGQATPLILRKCGTIFGNRLGQRFERELAEYSGMSLRDRTMNEFDFLLSDYWSVCGMGRLEVDWTKAEHGFLAATLHESPMLNIVVEGHASDHLFTGILEGFFSHYADEDMKCFQTADPRRGDKGGSKFILGPEDLVKRVDSMSGDGKSHGDILDSLAG